jgi:hypothetical protein
VALPVRQRRQKPTPSSISLGANDEHFRKNHERDFRQQVMIKLAANGGKLPPEIKH